MTSIKNKNKIFVSLKKQQMKKFNHKYGKDPEWAKKYFSGKDHPQQRCYDKFESDEKVKYDFWLSYQRPYIDKQTKQVKNTQSYYAYPTLDNFLNKYDTLNKSQKTFYEQIRGHCIEHYDIDGYCGAENAAGNYYAENSDDDIITDFINARLAFGKKTNKKYGRKEINTETDVYVLTSSSAEKKSFHISIRNSDLFESNIELGHYTADFSNFLDEGQFPFNFDRGIYTKNRNFRVIHSHKVGSKRILERSSWNNLSLTCCKKFFFNSWTEPEKDEHLETIGEVVFIKTQAEEKVKPQGPIIIRDPLGADKLSSLVGFIVEMVQDGSHSLCREGNNNLKYKEWFPLAMSVVRESIQLDRQKAYNLFGVIYDLYKNKDRGNIRPSAEEEYNCLAGYISDKFTSNSLHKWASENVKYEEQFTQEQKQTLFAFYKWKQTKLDDQIENGRYRCISDIPYLTNKCISKTVIENYIKEVMFVVEGGGDTTLVTKDKKWDEICKKWVNNFHIQLKVGKLMPASVGTLTSLTRAVKWVNPLYLGDTGDSPKKSKRSPTLSGGKKKRKKKDEDGKEEEEPLFIISSFSEIARDLFYSGQLKSYKDYIFAPYFDKPPSHTVKNFNLFTPFEFSKGNEKLCDDEEIKDEVIEEFEKSLIYKHISDVICNGEKIVGEYLHDWIAHMIQKPDDRAECEIVIHSDQGAGKDCLGQFIAHLIGEKYKATYGNLDDYCRNFNAEQIGKLLVVLNELDGQSSNNSKSAKNNSMKNKITDPKMRLEKKGIDAVFIDSFIRHLGLTNNEDCVYLEKSDRRYCLIKASNEFAQNPTYFVPLWKQIKSIKFLKVAFAYYAKRDISNYSPRNPPMTNYKKQQKERCLNSSLEFIKYIFTDLEGEEEEPPRSLLNLEEEKEEKDEVDIVIEEEKFDEFRKVDFYCHTDAIYMGYKQWCLENGNRQVKRRTFVSNLEQWGINQERMRVKKYIQDSELSMIFYNKYVDNKYGNQKMGYILNKFSMLKCFRKNLRDSEYYFW